MQENRGMQQNAGHPLSKIGVRELRNNVAAVLKRAGHGERIVVTVDGRPVAQLGPVEPAGASTLWDLASAGMIRMPALSHKPAPPIPHPLPADVRVDRLLDQIRGR